MDNWINEEAEKNRREQTAAEAQEYVISMSTYWTVLRSQIEQDIKAINANAEWHGLFNEDIGVEKIQLDGLLIKKTSFPGAFNIEVTNGDKEVTVKSFYKLDRDHSFEHQEAKLIVETERGQVLLKANNQESFLVPEQASHYILRSVMRAKDDSLRFFAEQPRG